MDALSLDSSIELRPGHCYLVLAPRPLGRVMMNTFAARLALIGPVKVLDGGNAFDALSIARQVRRGTPDLPGVLGRLQVARAFTCYQMAAMLSLQPASSQPVLAIDLLAMFCDESVSLAERSRLLDEALKDLRRLSAAAPLAVSAVDLPDERSGRVLPLDPRPPLGHPARLAAPLPGQLDRLKDAVDQVLRFEYPPVAVQPRLF